MKLFKSDNMYDCVLNNVKEYYRFKCEIKVENPDEVLSVAEELAKLCGLDWSKSFVQFATIHFVLIYAYNFTRELLNKKSYIGYIEFTDFMYSSNKYEEGEIQEGVIDSNIIKELMEMFERMNDQFNMFDNDVVGEMLMDRYSWHPIEVEKIRSIALEIFRRSIGGILTKEDVSYDVKALLDLIEMYDNSIRGEVFPDYCNKTGDELAKLYDYEYKEAVKNYKFIAGESAKL